MLAHQVHCHRFQGAVIDHLELLRGGKPPELLVLRKSSPARGYLHVDIDIGIDRFDSHHAVEGMCNKARRAC